MADTLVQPLQPYVPFVLESGLLTRNGYDFLNNLYIRVGGSLSELNAATLQDGTWQVPGTIGSTTPNTGAFTTFSAQTLSISGGITQNTGLKHGRVTTGSIGAGVSALVTFTFAGGAFANTNYTVTASVQDSTAATASLKVVHIETRSTTNVVVRVENTSAGALTGTLHIIAMHD